MITALSCPNCNASYNPENSDCEYCGSYIIFTNKKHEIYDSSENLSSTNKIYFNNILLNDNEYPIRSGLANIYYNAFTSDGGQLLLTNQRLVFVAHALNLNPNLFQEIYLDELSEVRIKRNMFITQKISLKDHMLNENMFVVYRGKSWVQDILRTR